MGSYGEPMGRDGLEELWQKYKVDLAVFGHIHSYERTCPIYQVNLQPKFSSRNYVTETQKSNSYTMSALFSTTLQDLLQ